MTPKEKAKILVDKMNGFTFHDCKQNALICVDEILSWNKTLFWEEVKQEIQNL